MNACTIIARNYLGYARVLASTFFEHHPDGHFTTLVIDGERQLSRAEGEDFDVLLPADLGLDEAELRRMQMLYGLMEFATAIKPSLLKHLLRQGASEIVYFDPDIEIFRPLDDVVVLGREHGIVLTPHTLDPLPHDRKEPGEVTLLLAGMFNLGFIGVGPSGAEFLDWWAERLARAGKVDPARGEFVDQRWVDFVPALFDHAVLRDPGCNVAHWNLVTRRFEWTDEGYLVDGAPLRFFHYSGFDPAKPFLLSKFLGPKPAVLLSEQPALARICSSYAEKLLAAGHQKHSRTPYGLDTLPNGVPIDGSMRWLYRRAVDAAELNGADEPPDAFADPHGFVAWLNEPDHPSAPNLTRYLRRLHFATPELRERFADPRWTDGDAYLDWIRRHGREELGIPIELIPPPRPTADDRRELQTGVNLAGYFRAQGGVGEVARQLVTGLEAAEIPFATLTFDELADETWPRSEITSPPYDVNVICVNADELPRFTYDTGPSFFARRHSVGVWWWEVGGFPERFSKSFDILNEVWVGSEFVREAVAAATDKPVLVMPVPVPAPTELLPRGRLGLPDRFIFLFSFDFRSVFDRKNPVGVIKAFRKAFSPNEGPMLVVKSINGTKRLRDLEELRAAALGRPDIHIWDAYVDPRERDSIVAACDCYVSLHRSEGFGFTIAEAMAAGKPAIATAYSGNLEYMTDENSYLVPSTLAEIPEGRDPYPAGAEWAEPDLDVAAALMRHVYDHPEEGRERGERARTDIRSAHSAERTAAFLRERLGEVWRIRAGAPVVAENPATTEESEGALERAGRFLEHGPSISLDAPSRLGPIGRAARRLVYRVLRPYTARQRELELALHDAIVEARRAAERSVDARATELLERLDPVERALAAARRGELRRLATLEERLDELEARLEPIRPVDPLIKANTESAEAEPVAPTEPPAG